MEFWKDENLYMEPITYAFLTFGSLFAILNPAATVPVFLAMTEENTAQERAHMARTACIVIFFVLAVFSLVGLSILSLFKISIPAFGIAGGIIILKAAMDMLQGSRPSLQESTEETEQGILKKDIAITPLAVPMLAGPGTITTVILLSNQATSVPHYIVLLVNVLLVSVLSFFVFRLAALYSWVLGEIPLKIMTRLMGLLLAGIAIQFVLNGIKEASLW